MKIILTGGTGFIGGAVLKELLEAGHSVSLLSRSERRSHSAAQKNLRTFAWDGKNQGIWSSEVNGADAVINLAGEPIAQKRWTPAQKAVMLNSRIDAARAIVAAIEKADKKPAVLVNASAVGFYGNVDSDDVPESYPKGTGYLADTCAQWETEAREAEKLGVRVVLTRMGVVIDLGGGALEKFIPPFRFFFGGPLGSGKQWFPWVHREDAAGAILFALSHPNVFGPVNVAAPDPVTMRQFCDALGMAMRRPSWATVPAFALRILLGEMAEMLIGGQCAIPKKLLDAGYKFRYPNLPEALEDIFNQKGR